MTDEPVNGTHLPNADATELHEPVPGFRVGIASVPIEMAPEQEVFEVKLRAPGIIRGCVFWYRQPKVLASSLRKDLIPQPMLLVECEPNAELQPRRFAFIPSNRVLNLKAGFRAEYRATAVQADGAGAGHVFEILEASS